MRQPAIEMIGARAGSQRSMPPVYSKEQSGPSERRSASGISQPESTAEKIIILLMRCNHCCASISTTSLQNVGVDSERETYRAGSSTVQSAPTRPKIEAQKTVDCCLFEDEGPPCNKCVICRQHLEKWHQQYLLTFRRVAVHAPDPS